MLALVAQDAPVKKQPWYLLGLVFWALVTVPVLFHEHQIEEGHEAFVRLGCANCHLSGGAPNLSNILRPYDKTTVEEFIRDPEAVYRRMGRRPLNPGFTTMHRVKVSPGETGLIAKYLKSL
jgi:hypothetical protein